MKLRNDKEYKVDILYREIEPYLQKERKDIREKMVQLLYSNPEYIFLKKVIPALLHEDSDKVMQCLNKL